MISRNNLREFFGCGDERPSCQMIGFSQETSRSLMDGHDSGIFEGSGFNAGDFGMMSQIKMHILKVEAFKVASGDDP
jgi:hypothetical protein